MPPERWSQAERGTMARDIDDLLPATVQIIDYIGIDSRDIEESVVEEIDGVMREYRQFLRQLLSWILHEDESEGERREQQQLGQRPPTDEATLRALEKFAGRETFTGPEEERDAWETARELSMAIQAGPQKLTWARIQYVGAIHRALHVLDTQEQRRRDKEALQPIFWNAKNVLRMLPLAKDVMEDIVQAEARGVTRLPIQKKTPWSQPPETGFHRRFTGDEEAYRLTADGEQLLYQLNMIAEGLDEEKQKKGMSLLSPARLWWRMHLPAGWKTGLYGHIAAAEETIAKILSRSDIEWGEIRQLIQEGNSNQLTCRGIRERFCKKRREINATLRVHIFPYFESGPLAEVCPKLLNT